MRIIRKLYEDSVITERSVKQQKVIDKENIKTANEASNLNSFFKKFGDFDTGWTPMVELVDGDSGDIVGLYKQWDIRIYTSLDKNALEQFALNYIPHLYYTVLWQESRSSELQYYARGTELQSNSFFEIQQHDLILNVSVSMEKYFLAKDLHIPQVKLVTRLGNIINLSN